MVYLGMGIAAAIMSFAGMTDTEIFQVLSLISTTAILTYLVNDYKEKRKNETRDN